ncbi:hypothetical protein SANTM175S_00280 [Streptomyces antimycoticus]
MQAKYTLFTTSGVPIRAVCQVTMEEITGETRGRIRRRARCTHAGCTACAPATRCRCWPGVSTGDPAAWRVIAETNGIDDPMRLPGGLELLLPALDELDRDEGAGAHGDGHGGGW